MRFLGIDGDKSYLNVVRYKFSLSIDLVIDVENSLVFSTSFMENLTKSLVILK